LALCVAPAGAWAASCTVTNSGISFGAYDPLSSQPRDTNATIQNTCSGSAGENVSYTIGASEVSGGSTYLTLSNGPTSLLYNLYLDAGRSVPWGNGTNGTNPIQDSITIGSGSTSKTYTIYGRIFGGQYTATSGAYADQLIITVSY
jgi:spore coat protein U-like protein